VKTCQRVLVVEDDSRMANIIRVVLDEAGFTALEVAHTARNAEARMRTFAPDMLLVDLGLPDKDGAELIRTVRACSFQGRILVLTSAIAPERILAALRAGADGYLFKDDLDARLAGSLFELANGESPLSGGAAAVVLRELRFGAGPPSHDAAAPVLTAREASVLELLATGFSYAEIARELAVGLNTVRTHIRSLYDKLAVENRAEAVNLGWNVGLLRQR
jgi:DNA-binding NarL/FixJ family response regulator